MLPKKMVTYANHDLETKMETQQSKRQVGVHVFVGGDDGFPCFS